MGAVYADRYEQRVEEIAKEAIGIISGLPNYKWQFDHIGTIHGDHVDPTSTQFVQARAQPTDLRNHDHYAGRSAYDGDKVAALSEALMAKMQEHNVKAIDRDSTPTELKASFGPIASWVPNAAGRTGNPMCENRPTGSVTLVRHTGSSPESRRSTPQDTRDTPLHPAPRGEPPDPDGRNTDEFRETFATLSLGSAMAELFPPAVAPQAARLAPKLRELAGKGMYFGTSSWKYEGWLGSIYSDDRYLTRGKHSKKKFEETCLQEYACTFPTVCGDFAFYQFPSEQYWEKLFEAVPKGFIFGLKVPEDITVARWPKHARYGKKAGTDNEHFLDTGGFAQFFAQRLKPYRDQVGPLIFEFGALAKSDFAKPEDFTSRLDPFLGSLPKGFRYAVEIRNPEYLTPAYLGMLASHNVAHVFNAWTRMPRLDEQARIQDAYTADFAVVRALLTRGRSYEQAVKTFEPYRETQAVDEGARDGMRRIVADCLGRKAPAFLFVNNRLEGNAPSTLEAVAGGF